ncbi:MAG: VanZ family protein [Candidatus Omnitrophica bacterium]|nr:VanZ family protein [Candidatus Omnitrophota bacterium]
MKRRLWLWAPVGIYTAFIFWLSSAPRPIPGIQRFPWMDKPLHLLEYLPLGSLMARAVAGSFSGLAVAAASAWAFGGAAAVGILDELYQGRVPLRVSSPWDTLFDCIGAALGLWVYQRFLRRKRASTPTHVR